MNALKTFKHIQNFFQLWEMPFKRLCYQRTDGRTDRRTKKWLIESRSTRLKRVEMLILRNCEKIVRRYFASKWLDILFQMMPLQIHAVFELQKGYSKCRAYKNSHNWIKFERKSFLHPAWTFIFSKIVHV